MSQHVYELYPQTYVMMLALQFAHINRISACIHSTVTTMETPTLFRWTWEWNDYGDEIISSKQKFLTREMCQMDALRHYPYISSAEWNGRTGSPEAKITESTPVETRWIMVFYDHCDMEIARYAADEWYNSMAECIHAAKKLKIKTTRLDHIQRLTLNLV